MNSQFDILKAIVHYGVPGMKWGIRRNRRTPSTDYSTSRALKKKKSMELSNDEIEKLNRRLQLEKKRDELDPSVLSTGKNVVSKFMGQYGNAVISATAAAASAATVAKILKHSDELFHYGVPGMKCGVRKDRRSGSSRRSSTVKKGLESFKKEVSNGRAWLERFFADDLREN